LVVKSVSILMLVVGITIWWVIIVCVLEN
jgi:hypothetical protein